LCHYLCKIDNASFPLYSNLYPEKKIDSILLLQAPYTNIDVNKREERKKWFTRESCYLLTHSFWYGPKHVKLSLFFIFFYFFYFFFIFFYFFLFFFIFLFSLNGVTYHGEVETKGGTKGGDDFITSLE
jgi:hypothetical protein